MSKLRDLCEFIGTASGQDQFRMSAVMRHLQHCGLLPRGRSGRDGSPAASVEAAVWLLLTALAGQTAKPAVEEAQKLARLRNTAQTINGLPWHGPEPDMTLFAGLRDALNVRRARLFLADLRLQWSGETPSGTIAVRAFMSVPQYRIADDTPSSVAFIFEKAGVTGDGPRLHRLAVADYAVLGGMAEILGPLPEESQIVLDQMFPPPPAATMPDPHLATMH